MAAPTIASTKPDSNQLGVRIYDDVTAEFTAPIQFLRHDQANEPLVFTLKDSTNTVILQRIGAAGSTEQQLRVCTYNDQTRTARLRVYANLPALSQGATYTASINGAVDLDGTPMTVAHTWSFQTGGWFAKTSGNSFSVGSATTKTLQTSGPPVAGYSLWLDASKLALTDGASVTTWTDSSTNENDATASTDKPIFKTNIQNGLPGVLLTKGSNYFTVSLPLSQPYTHFLVVKAVGGTDFEYVVDGGLTNTGVIQLSPTKLRMNAGTIFDVTIADMNVPLIISCVFNGASSVSGVNGVEETGDAATGNVTALTIGADGGLGYPSYWYGGYVFEMISYPSAVSPTDRTSVVNYLNSRYSVF